EWHRVVVFNEGLCKLIEQYLKKGSKVYIEGALQTRKWTDQSGQERYSTEIVLQGFNSTLTMLDGRSGGGSPERSIREPERNETRRSPAFEDEIPFCHLWPRLLPGLRPSSGLVIAALTESQLREDRPERRRSRPSLTPP